MPPRAPRRRPLNRPPQHGWTRTQQPPWLLFSFVLCLVSVAAGCEGCLKRPPAEHVERLPYPTCPGMSELPAGEVLASGHLRSGPEMRDQAVVEHWELRRRACLHVMTIRQEWPMGISDVEVVFDEQFRPLRAWKRMSMPRPPAGRRAPTPDTRLYELRTTPPTMTRQSEDGHEYFTFRAETPVAVVGPGRALIGAWIRQHLDLGAGETVVIRVAAVANLTPGNFFVDEPCDLDLAAPFFSLGSEDVLALTALVEVSDSNADLNDDGFLDFFDVTEYLRAFDAGCP